MFPSSRAFRVLAIVLGLGFVLSGCDSLYDFNLRSLTEPFRPDEKKLPGERREALPAATLETGTTADPVALGGAEANAAWSQPGGNAANAPGHLAGGRGAVAFTASIGQGSSRSRRVSVTPIVTQGVIVAMDGAGTVTALSSGGGGRSWSVSLVPEDEDVRIVYGGGLAADQGRVFVSSPFGPLVALDLASGNTLWTAELIAPVRGAPTAAGGRVYVVSANNTVHALDINDGTEVWSFDGIPEASGILANTSPAVSGNRVIVPYSSGEIIAFDAAEGTPVWADQLAGASRLTAVSGFADVAARPVVFEGTVYAISVSGRLSASALDDGERRWAANLASAHTPAVSGNTIFVLTLTGEIVALDRSDGAIRWQVRLPTEDRVTWSGPLLAGNALWVTGSTGRIIRVDAVTGQILSDTPFGTEINLPPIAAGGVIYILDDSGRLSALN